MVTEREKNVEEISRAVSEVFRLIREQVKTGNSIYPQSEIGQNSSGIIAR